ncbi:N-acetylgalactosamine-6-sulfatase [soil metagenome]
MAAEEGRAVHGVRRRVARWFRVGVAGVAGIVLVIVASILGGGNALAARQPNLVVLMADDLGVGELFTGAPDAVPTPHLDALAAGGTRFSQAYVTAPNCSPSRAGFLTGRAGTRFGYEFNPTGAKNEDPAFGLPQGETTLAEFLRAAGYATGLVGKWHLGGTADYHPQRHGFDTFFGFLHEGHYFVPPPYEGTTTMLRRTALPGGGKGRWQSADGRLVYSTHMGNNEPPYDANNPVIRDGQPVVEDAYLTAAIAREATTFLGQHREEPFFLFVAFNAVHSPLQATDELMDRVAGIADVHRRIFAAMLVGLDDAVGEILGELEALGLAEDTLVVFLSDNGGPTRELTSGNGIYRGEKSDVYEGGLRVPFVVRWPGHIPAGAVYDEPVWSVDVFATAAAAAGMEAPSPLDGVDLMPYLLGEDPGVPHAQLYWRQGGRTALREGDWKIVKNPGWGKVADAWELFNLADDPSESTDLAGSEPAKLEALASEWERWDGEMREALFR